MTPSLDIPYGASCYRVYASQRIALTRWFPIARYTYGLAGAATPRILVAMPKHLTRQRP